MKRSKEYRYGIGYSKESFYNIYVWISGKKKKSKRYYFNSFSANHLYLSEELTTCLKNDTGLAGDIMAEIKRRLDLGYEIKLIGKSR